MNLTYTNLAANPELEAQVQALHDEAWPTFMQQTPAGERNWNYLFEPFSELQIAVHREGELLAIGHTIPARWDGTEEGLPEGWDALMDALPDIAAGKVTPNVISGVAVVIRPQLRGQGVADEVLKQMRGNGERLGFNCLVIPVRPTLKTAYPLQPMEQYMKWTRDDGAPFDPWLRAHWRVGGKLLRPAPRSMEIPGTVAEWEEWAGMKFPQSGRYVVQGALNPVEVDREADRVVYIEENAWVLHGEAPK